MASDTTAAAASSALEEIAAAERLAADPELGSSLARPHLQRAWELLHAEQGGDEDLLSWSGSQVEQRADQDEREGAERTRVWALADEANGEAPTADSVFALTRAMRSIAPKPAASTSRFARIGGSMLAGMLLLMVVAAAVSISRGPVGPWRGEWYSNQDFKGEPYIQHTRKIEFNWGREGPRVPGIPHDRWSVIWRTCMEVDEDTQIRFRVSSDDGTRLYIDGEKIVDNWGAHAVRTRTGKTELTAGVHYIRIDYFEASATAEVKVVAAIGDSKDYVTIPPSMLSEPSDGEDPC